MFKITFVAVVSLVLTANSSRFELSIQNTDEDVRNLLAYVDEQGKSYDDLKELTDIGHRLAGSENNLKAEAWAKAKLETLGLDKVWLQPVTIKKWVRGDTGVAVITDDHNAYPAFNVAALGGSVGTNGRLIANVVEVKSLQDVARLGESLRGKIVFFNRPMDPNINSFAAYSGAVDQRVYGASAAAKFGAKAVLVRSMTTLPNDDHPHTGMVSYAIGTEKIPAAALSTRSANSLSSELAAKPNLKVLMEFNCKYDGTAVVNNVVGEWTGTTNEIVTVGGHLDSWDLGAGAHDDGAGVVQSIETMRALKSLNKRFNKTVRVVLFANEENGVDGGNEYAKLAAQNGERHYAALESDRGGFSPEGFSADSDEMLVKLNSWKQHFEMTGATHFQKGGGGADVEPLHSLGAATFGLISASAKYFNYHHASNDQLDAVDANELLRGSAAMSVLVYLLAN